MPLLPAWGYCFFAYFWSAVRSDCHIIQQSRELRFLIETQFDDTTTPYTFSAKFLWNYRTSAVGESAELPWTEFRDRRFCSRLEYLATLIVHEFGALRQVIILYRLPEFSDAILPTRHPRITPQCKTWQSIVSYCIGNRFGLSLLLYSRRRPAVFVDFS